LGIGGEGNARPGEDDVAQIERWGNSTTRLYSICTPRHARGKRALPAHKKRARNEKGRRKRKVRPSGNKKINHI